MLVLEKRSIYFAFELPLRDLSYVFLRARAHVRAQMTQIACAVGMRNTILRNHLNQGRLLNKFLR